LSRGIVDTLGLSYGVVCKLWREKIVEELSDSQNCLLTEVGLCSCQDIAADNSSELCNCNDIVAEHYKK